MDLDELVLHPWTVQGPRDLQADRLCTLAPGHASDVRGEAARMIVDVAPDGLGHVLFTTGGTEAIEHAVRMARLHNGRPQVLAAYRSYHGSTTTSIHLTGDPHRWASDTGAAGAVHFFGPFLATRRADLRVNTAAAVGRTDGRPGLQRSAQDGVAAPTPGG